MTLQDVSVVMSSDGPAPATSEAAGPLAEFTALRGELLQMNQQQHQITALQLTLMGAIFGIAISRPNMVGLLMIAPIIGYSLCMLHLTNGLTIFEIARYIRDDLSGRVPGAFCGKGGWYGMVGKASRTAL
jgi:hypothetical protein